MHPLQAKQVKCVNEWSEMVLIVRVKKVQFPVNQTGLQQHLLPAHD